MPVNSLQLFETWAVGMKKTVILCSILMLLLAGVLWSGVIISSFQGEAGFNRVELKWIVSSEINLRQYQVLRSFDGTTFENIAQVPVKENDSGEKTYLYVDTSVFKDVSRDFYYKLRMVHQDGTTSDYDKVLRLNPQISSARQTWGSIKAMFR
jgi:hypothetical protein